MKTLIVLAWFVSVSAIPAMSQLSQEIAAGLHSADFEDRYDAFTSLIDRKNPLSNDEESALIELLLTEEQTIYELNKIGMGASEKYGEGYGLYVGLVQVAVMAIAEKEPDRPNLWRALVHSAYNPGSEFADWLANHGDKTAPLLFEKAADPVEREWALPLEDLALILQKQRTVPAAERLKQEQLQAIDAAIRTGLSDPNPSIRSNAINAISQYGTSEDVSLLERVALTDPYVVTDGGATGAEIKFMVRDRARQAADRLRKRLQNGAKTQ